LIPREIPLFSRSRLRALSTAILEQTPNDSPSAKPQPRVDPRKLGATSMSYARFVFEFTGGRRGLHPSTANGKLTNPSFCRSFFPNHFSLLSATVPDSLIFPFVFSWGNNLTFPGWPPSGLQEVPKGHSSQSSVRGSPLCLETAVACHVFQFGCSPCFRPKREHLCVCKKQFEHTPFLGISLPIEGPFRAILLL